MIVFLIRRIVCIPIIFLLFLCVFTLAGEQAHVSSFGAVVESTPSVKKDGVVEKVLIYPQIEDGSLQKIVRKGVLTRCKNAEATILLCHGFMCEKYDIAILRQIFSRRRFNVMIFDFRGHGENADGQHCTFGRDEALDVIAATNFIKSHPALKDKPVIAYGFSMGAVSAIEAQARDSSLFDAMILDCPFDSTENVLKRGLANVKFRFFGYQFSIPCRTILERYAFHPYVQSLVKAILKTVAQMDPQDVHINMCRINPVKTIQHIKVPCFFILCKNDEKVSVQGIKSVFHNAAGHKRLWLTQGRRHFDSYFYNPEKYTQKIRTFLNHVLAGKYKNGPIRAIIEDDDEGQSIFYKQRGRHEHI